jgi:hypothetical protein
VSPPHTVARSQRRAAAFLSKSQSEKVAVRLPQRAQNTHTHGELLPDTNRCKLAFNIFHAFCLRRALLPGREHPQLVKVIFSFLKNKRFIRQVVERRH